MRLPCRMLKCSSSTTVTNPDGEHCLPGNPLMWGWLNSVLNRRQSWWLGLEAGHSAHAKGLLGSSPAPERQHCHSAYVGTLGQASTTASLAPAGALSQLHQKHKIESQVETAANLLKLSVFATSFKDRSLIKFDKFSKYCKS